jgi:hypothetical protein
VNKTRLPGAEQGSTSTQGRRFECRTCGLPPAYYLTRGHCNACYSYWHKYGRERPAQLWRRNFTSAAAERLAHAGQ